MRGNAEGVGATSREQILELVQRRGTSQRALILFAPQASALVRNVSAVNASSKALPLLRAAVERRVSDWTQSPTIERDTKRQRVSSSSKNDVVFAAKVAQSLVKVYAAAAGAAAKEDELEDLVAAMDLACVALYVVCTLEHAVRLGDLVVDNLLYQVAKKCAEIPEMREVALCVAACVHIRLWEAHSELYNKGSEKSQLMKLLDRQDEGNIALSSKVMENVGLLAEFPTPRSPHSAQFARLLLGHTNTCVSLLSAMKNYEAVLLVAETTLSPWIPHLQRSSQQDAKLASSFSDRTFRVLWKIAAAVDGVKPKATATSGALQFRLLALSFLLKCSNYTSSYFIQQVHRVGVQHERATKRSQQGLEELIWFYDQSANTLSEAQPTSTHMYSSESLQWEYIQWLEHFALICEVSGMHLRSAMILENAVQYVQLFGSAGKLIEPCLVFSIAGALFSSIQSEKRENCLSSSRGGFSNSAIDKNLENASGKMIRDLVHGTSDKWTDQCEKAARVYLKKLEALAPFSFVSLDSKDHPLFVPFVIRSLKRSATKTFNYVISVQHSAKYQLYHQVITSFDELCKAVKELRSTVGDLDVKMLELLVLEQSRLHRMEVILSVRCCLADSTATTKPALRMLSRHVTSARELLDNATLDGKLSDSIINGVLGDLNAIARECYSCATCCYKTGDYQDTISALLGAFELVESYLEYVMCSNMNLEGIQKAHSQLKADAIASLLAHCYRELGNCTKAKLFTGYSILYCGDMHEQTPQTSVDKYVSCILEDAKLLGEEALPVILNEFKSFLDNIIHVFKSRRIPENQIMALWRAFRDAFNRESAKIVVSMRGNSCALSDAGVDVSPVIRVQLCDELEHYLNVELMKTKMTAMNDELPLKVLRDASQSLAKRKLIYCCYYAKRNVHDTIEGLLLVYHALTAAAENLSSFRDAVGVDLGGIYGWRGVVTMEIALMMSYGGSSDEFVTPGSDISVSEESAIGDIERCLAYWGREDVCGFLFDGLYAVQCLESVCNTLSLSSCFLLEQAARKLLRELQQCQGAQGLMPNVIPPPVGLLRMNSSTSIVKAEGETSAIAGNNRELLLFEQVDRDLFAAKTSHLGAIRDQACQHLLRAMKTLGDIKQNVKYCQTAPVAKAIGMRQLFVHTILSDIHFYEGRSQDAIAEAKSALRVCWKIAKKFTAPSSPSETKFFELPPEIVAGEYLQRKSAHFLYFMALECSSWDLLLAAKVSLCRIASLYSMSDQPHRAASYLTEAMRLVGGLNLRFFRRGPFYEYAELELNANHLEKAKVAISLLSSNSKSDLHCPGTSETIVTIADACHSGMPSDLAVIEQRCNEIVQQGDVYLNEAKQQEALACYANAIEIVESAEDCRSPISKRLGRVKARSWRKYTRLQSEVSDLSDQRAVESLLGAMKKLKRSLKSCDIHLERVKCMLELGRINTRLLRSASPRAFNSLGRTLSLLEEAYVLGDHLGIPHLNQELRTALGMAYFAEIEENSHEDADSMDGDERATFLSWASSALLANAGSGDAISVETDRDTSTPEGLVGQLERLAAGPSACQKQEPQEYLTRMAQDIAEEVQQLPDNWIIVSLMIGVSSELVVTRFPTNGSAPVSFCLPTVSWSKCIREMDAIIQDSGNTLSGHTAEETSSWKAEQKKKWWDTRKLLDRRIEEAVVSMQESLGFWRCLLVGGSNFDGQVRRCWDLLTQNTADPIKLADRNQSLLCAIADAQQYLSDSEVIDGLKHIAAEIEVPLSDSGSREALQVLRTSRDDSAPSSPEATYSNLTSLSKEEIARMNVGEVKQLLAAEGLSTDGLKKVLVARLTAARDAALVDRMRSSTGRCGGGSNADFSTILILNHQLQQFPWEAMDVMSLSSGVTRMPSLDLIVQNAKSYSPVRRDRVRYLLNPAGDLKSTQHQLGPILEDGATSFGWEGIVGEVPDPEKLRNYLLAADLYIYCGHGSGEAYLNRDKVLSLQSDCSAALLFGCSSGRLEREGIFGPSGAVLAYLRAGSPAVLAMLWDVTDRDIDQLSVNVLQEWLLADDEDDEDDDQSLAQILQSSRSVCKLKYLNGHAAVCYGLPLYVAKS
ncbi:Peptidase family C50 [Phytophthora infestans]|uniref:separase n=1 Tax=Phytophthora infestans TaxID=4787 RepID=A0A8S9U4I1_PHYIN|nr:Peptidase family C50 [Phytophthora infestans]